MFVVMGVGRIFFQGGGCTRGFFQNFSVGVESGEICFFLLETKKTTFFGEIFKFLPTPCLWHFACQTTVVLMFFIYVLYILNVQCSFYAHMTPLSAKKQK